MDTPDRRGNAYGFYSNSGLGRPHHHYRQKPCRGSEKKYFLEEFKKIKRPIFYGDVKKSKDTEAWLLVMKKFFRLHDYSKNMKAKITTLSLNGEVDIWWEDAKRVSIKVEELSWDELRILFKNKYLSERYYDGKAKEFYELRIGYMTNEEYMTKFLELLRYVPYLKDHKTKVQSFINGLPLEFKDWIEYDEP